MNVLYKLLGLVTWKALKLYVSQKVPRRAVAAAGVAVAIAALAGLAAARSPGDGA
jgi:hypothetical protein